MYSLLTTICPMLVIIAIITELRHAASFLLNKNKTKTSIYLAKVWNWRNWIAEPSECSRVAPPGGERARDSQLVTCASSASSGWRSSGSRSCWRGLWAWRSSRTRRCSWNRGSRTRWTGCSRCGGGRAGTAPGWTETGQSFRLGSTGRPDDGGAGAYQLQGREVSLPPQVLLHVGADGCQAVIRVHDYVDEGVCQADEERCDGVNSIEGKKQQLE